MKKYMVLGLCVILLTSCRLFVDDSTATPSQPDDAQANMPNPASVFCEENGGTVENRKDEQGNEYGYCIFSDGSECDEWAYYRGECAPGDSLSGNANLPNPASVYCEEQGYTLEIRTAEDGSQSGFCLFPDGSECDEWAFFRGECGPAGQNEGSPVTETIPTAIPINPEDYEGWWTYTHPEYGFSLMLPEDWEVEDTTTSDPLMSGHYLDLHPEEISLEENSLSQNIRLSFRSSNEDILLWPTGVGQGEFIEQGTLEIAGQPSQRLLLVCPSGEVTAIWYHDGDGQANISRSDMEFGFIYSAGTHCEPGLSLTGKIQYVGEMIIASLIVP